MALTPNLSLNKPAKSDLSWWSLLNANSDIIDGLFSDPTRTSGSVLYYDSANKIADDSANFFWDAVNKRIGLKTTAPLGIFHLIGAAENINAFTISNTVPADATSATGAGLPGSLILQDSDGAAGSGGGMVFGASQGYFAGIKALLSDGGNNSAGHLILATRTLSTDATITEKVRVTNDGKVGLGMIPTVQLDLSTDGARKLTTTTWTTGSDARIKTDIQDIDDALEILRRVRPVKFRYNAEFLMKHPSVRDVPYYNFISQEFRKVFPDSVTESDGLLYLNSSHMIPYAVAAIKKLDEQVTELRAHLFGHSALGGMSTTPA